MQNFSGWEYTKRRCEHVPGHKWLLHADYRGIQTTGLTNTVNTTWEQWKKGGDDVRDESLSKKWVRALDKALQRQSNPAWMMSIIPQFNTVSTWTNWCTMWLAMTWHLTTENTLHEESDVQYPCNAHYLVNGFPAPQDQPEQRGTNKVYLVNDGLHVRLVRLVPVKQGGPLVRRDPQARLHRNLHYLRVMFPPQRFIGSKFLLQLHQRRVLITFGDLLHTYHLIVSQRKDKTGLHFVRAFTDNR